MSLKESLKEDNELYNILQKEFNTAVFQLVQLHY